MADSDYDYEEDASDDEYIGGKSSASSSRAAHASKGKKEEQQPRKLHAWETEDTLSAVPYNTSTIEEAEDGTIQQSVQEREEERKRKRLRKDTMPFQRGIIRHVVLVLDISEAMLEKDMRPNRYITMIKYAQEYVREFFEQNPISQMSVLGMHDGLCIRVSELSGNPADHIAAIQDLRFPRNPKEVPKEPKGSPSLQNALELSRATLYHTPRHGTREVIIVFGSLLSLDPGDIFKTIKDCVQDRVRVSIIGMGARMKICTEIVSRTNAGDESEYVVATDQEQLRELLLATTTPPVVRSNNPAAAAPEQSAAALMMMGFPSRVVEDVPTMCACHGALTTGGYTCSRCKAKVCSLPVTCPSCQLTLLLSTHLARSYHHLFPLRNWAEVSWRRAFNKGSRECTGCLATFPELPTLEELAEAEAQNGEEGTVGRRQRDQEEDEEQRASESARYECRVCESHFCIDCDVFAHMVLHNCPGCLSKLNPATEAQNGDVNMTG